MSIPSINGQESGCQSHYPLTTEVSAEKEQWLKKHPLQPAATFDGAGTVRIDVYKPDLTGQQFLANLTPYRMHRRTSLVETSFDFTVEGVPYQFTAVRNMGFHPVITKVTRDENAADDGKVGISWKLVPAAKADELIATTEFQNALGAVLTETGNETLPSAYVAKIKGKVDEFDAVEGVLQYDTRNGVATYSQHVESATGFIQAVTNFFGAKQIIGAAMKVAYLSVGEPEFAGSKGKYGKSVTAMDEVSRQSGP